MPSTKASKVKKAKAGKGKKNAEQESKVDRESEAERAKASAALWELRLKVTKQSLAECEAHCHKLASANTHLTEELYRLEKDAVDLTGYWTKREAAKEEKVCQSRMTPESLREPALEDRRWTPLVYWI